MLKPSLTQVVVAVSMYATSWILAYMVVMGLNLSHLVDYFILAWTFRGFELPVAIQVVSMFLFLFMGAFFSIMKRIRRSRFPNGRPY